MEKSLFPKQMMMNSSLSLESVASKLLFFQEQLHLLHWQTSGYAEHMATGGLYTYIESFRDDIIEKIMGYCGRRPTLIKVEPLINTTAVAVVTEMLAFASELKKWGESNSYHDVCNLADSFSGECAKTKYLLTLS